MLGNPPSQLNGRSSGQLLSYLSRPRGKRRELGSSATLGQAAPAPAPAARTPQNRAAGAPSPPPQAAQGHEPQHPHGPPEPGAEPSFGELEFRPPHQLTF